MGGQGNRREWSKSWLQKTNNAQEKGGKTTSAKTCNRGLKNAFATELRKHLVENVCTADIINAIFKLRVKFAVLQI